jgi:Apea-like HEPN
MVEGRCTEAALKEATREIKDVITSLLKCFYLIEDFDSEKRIQVSISKKIAPLKAAREKTETEASNNEQLPILNFEVLGETLGSYFSDPTKKDSLARRIRNAVHFLVESDRQAKNGVGLALSVVAMETLLCRKGSDLANTLAEHVAVLLEPVPSNRRSAETFVKKLYDKRSNVLHGTETDFPADDLSSARLLASGVLISFVARRILRRRAGYDDQTPDELLNELRDRKYLPGLSLWDQDSPVVELWR